jgi:hypothetical protein
VAKRATAAAINNNLFIKTSPFRYQLHMIANDSKRYGIVKHLKNKTRWKFLHPVNDSIEIVIFIEQEQEGQHELLQPVLQRAQQAPFLPREPAEALAPALPEQALAERCVLLREPRAGFAAVRQALTDDPVPMSEQRRPEFLGGQVWQSAAPPPVGSQCPRA